VHHQPVGTGAGYDRGRVSRGLRYGCQVEDARAVTGQGRDDHLDRDLGADDQEVLWLGEGRVDLGRADLVVGAGGDRDDVLARAVDRDHGQAGRGVRRDADAVVADAVFMQGGQQAAAEVVI